MRIEEKVNEIVDVCIVDRLDLNIAHLSYMFSAHILYNHIENSYMSTRGIDVIALKLDEPHKMWKAFCHEAGHMFLHCTDQRRMPRAFNRMQEAEAEKFAILLMMPEKLIMKHELYDAQQVANYFDVPFDLALQRIEMLIEQTQIVTYN